MKKSCLFLLIVIIFSSCDYMVSGSLENKTEDTVRVVCFRTADAPLTFCIEGASEEYNHETGGRFFGVNRTEDDQRYFQMSDSTVYFDIAPHGFFGMGMPMNHFWFEERIRVYLRYIKRLEIRMPDDTLVYDGEKELIDLFLDNKVSKQEVRINIRKKSVFNPILDYFNF